MTTHIRVSEAVMDTVDRVKNDSGHTNRDSAIREVLMEAGIEVKKDEDVDKSKWGLDDE